MQVLTEKSHIKQHGFHGQKVQIKYLINYTNLCSLIRSLKVQGTKQHVPFPAPADSTGTLDTNNKICG